MAFTTPARGALLSSLPLPKRIRIVVFNALAAKGDKFLKRGVSPGVVERVSRTKPLRALATEEDDPPEFEVVAPSKATLLGAARIESKVVLQTMEDCPQSFGELGVAPVVEEYLGSMGIKQPTPVQAATIPIILEGKDTAVQCYTGSGKTLAYMIPVLMKALARAQDELDLDLPADEFGQLQALIVAPSRELAMQIVRVAKSLLPVEARPAVHQAIGGANYSRQVDALRERPIIVVGTPGRLADHSRSGHLLTHKCPILVLDEVDQLMAPHFTEDMRRLTEHCGKRLPHRETILVSATLTEAAVERAGQWAVGANFTYVTSQASAAPVSQIPQTTKSKPKWGWGTEPPTTSSAGGMETRAVNFSLPPTLKHGYIVSSASRKVDTLRRCIHGIDAQKALVFMNYQQRLQDTVYKLAAKKMKVGSLHGEKDKLDREKTLKAFRDGEFRTLIVSDVIARGLDVQDCDAVFNLEMPSDPAHYAHRAGRTGRMGREGWVVSILTIRQVFVIEKIARQLGIQISELEASGGEVRVKGAFERTE